MGAFQIFWNLVTVKDAKCPDRRRTLGCNGTDGSLWSLWLSPGTGFIRAIDYYDAEALYK